MTNSKTISSHVSQPASADPSELQVHHCMTPEQWIRLLCSVGFIPANKLSLQELNQQSEKVSLKPYDWQFNCAN